MNYNFQEILDVGLEIEFSNIKRDTMSFQDALYKKIGGFKSVHDASAESPELTLANIPIQFNVAGKSNRFLSILKFKGLETIGGELNSPILSSKEYKEHIYKLTDFLIDMGESYSTTEQDARGSIHVHINCSKDVRHKHLIRFLEVGLATEAIFYRLGGMGRVNRGTKNSFVYQRPLTMPPCYLNGYKFIPIYDYKDLLKSTDKEDFYNKYGDSIYHIENGNHYVTQRYSGLNFYSIPYRGSLEFRYCNKTLIPEWICAWIVLCQAFVNYSLTKDKDDTFENKYRKLEDNANIPEDEVMYIFEKFGISEDDTITLMDIWKHTEVPFFNGQHILTHLENPTFFRKELKYYPSAVENANKINVDNVRNIANDKNNILSKVRNKHDSVELDYVIDDSGVKVKLKELNIDDIINDFNLNFEHNDVPEMFEITRDTLEFYNKMGFNLRNYNQNEAITFTQNRIAEGKFIPFRLLRQDWWYEFATEYDDLTISFKVNNMGHELEVVMNDTENDLHSESLFYNSIYKAQYKSYGFGFGDIIQHAHYNPNEYFDDGNDEVFNDDNNDENDNAENIQRRIDEMRENLRRNRR